METEPAKTDSNKRLRRVRNLLAEKWPEYLIEVLVIILSISISLGVDEWKDTRQKRETEQNYLKSLRNDLQRDVVLLEEIIAETQTVLRKTQSLLTISKTGQPPADVHLNADVRYIMRRPRFVAEEATFADLKSTGNMQLLTSMDLKRALFDYYTHYEAIVQVENAELNTTTNIIGPYLLDRFSLTDDGMGSREAKKLVVHPTFKNIVFVRQANRQELLGEYKELTTQARIILQLVQKQLKE